MRVYDAKTNELLAECDDSLELSLNNFDALADEEQTLGRKITAGLRGEEHQAFQVDMDFDYGFNASLEVYPSQNYITNTPKDFSRSLYYVGEPPELIDHTDAMQVQGIRKLGQAALRSTKISNALRTIDTWYPDFEDYGRPIPIEPNGANLDAQFFFRGDRKSSAFDIARRFNTLDPNEPDGMFMIGILMRGGVLSGAKEEAGD